MKCEICGQKINITFMNKIVGTFYTKGKKKKTVCKDCQKIYSSKDIKEKLHF